MENRVQSQNILKACVRANPQPRDSDTEPRPGDRDTNLEPGDRDTNLEQGDRDNKPEPGDKKKLNLNPEIKKN